MPKRAVLSSMAQQQTPPAQAGGVDIGASAYPTTRIASNICNMTEQTASLTIGTDDYWALTQHTMISLVSHRWLTIHLRADYRRSTLPERSNKFAALLPDSLLSRKAMPSFHAHSGRSRGELACLSRR